MLSRKLNTGIQPTCLPSQLSKPRMRGSRKSSPHTPKMIDGIAAIRSITAMSGLRSDSGEYSEMYRAIAIPVGTAMTIAITAMRMPSGRIAAMPKCCGS